MAGYDSHQTGDAMEFSTTPETVPFPLVLLAIPGTALILLGFFAGGLLWGLVTVAFCYGASYLLMHSKQATKYRTPSTFRVTKNGVEIGGATIPKDAIHRVVVRNHVLKSAENIIIAPVAAGQANNGQANVVAGMNWAIQKLGPISYRVDVEARGVPTTLAGGLTEPTASAIAMDVNNRLQMSAGSIANAAVAGN